MDPNLSSGVQTTKANFKVPKEGTLKTALTELITLAAKLCEAPAASLTLDPVYGSDLICSYNLGYTTSPNEIRFPFKLEQPLTDIKGQPWGTLHLHNNQPLYLSTNQLSTLASFGRQASALMDLTNDLTHKFEVDQALIESEERYRKLVELSPDTIAIMFDAKIDFVNKAGVEFYGADSPSEILGRPLMDFFHPDSHGAVRERMGMILSGTSAPAIDLMFIRKDGAIIEAESRAVAFPWKGGQAALAVIRNITERKMAEAALRYSEERYRTLATVSPVGLYRTDPEDHPKYVNDYLCKILGLSRTQLESHPTIITIHPKDEERVRVGKLEAAANGTPFHAEFRILRDDGAIVWVLGNSLVEYDDERKVKGYLGTITDITERKEAEILLACQKSTLAHLADGWSLKETLGILESFVEKETYGALGGTLLLDSLSQNLKWASGKALQGGLPHSSPAFPAGQESGPIGKALFTREQTICPDLQKETTWKIGHKEALLHGYFSCAIHPIIGSNEQPLGVFILFFPRIGEPTAFEIKILETAAGLAGIAVVQKQQADYSRKLLELSEKNRIVEEASRMKSEFLASMSHELRTPLNAVIGLSQLLKDGKAGLINSKQDEYLGDILSGGMHLFRLINDILDLSKIEAGKIELNLESINVGLAIREVCDLFFPLAMEKNIRLIQSISPEVNEALLDSQKFRQVLYNLISNAIKFSPKGGQVTVATTLDAENGLKLQVSDNGIGIKKEDIGRLFQQFIQLDSGSKRKFSGTGLGLVITKKLVELHRGHVGVESEFGTGSTFYAIFPK